MKTRPSGITLIALGFILLAGFSVLWGFLQFGIGGLEALFGSIFGAENMAATGGGNFVGGMLNVAFGVVQFATGIGLLMMKKWAWLLAVIAIGMSVVQGIIGMFSGGIFVFVCGLIWIALPAAILWYLVKPATRKLFGQ